MEEGRKEVSFLVFVGFLVLFVLFLFLNPGQKSSGNVVIGSVTLGENPSIITLVILFVILVVVLAAAFVIFRKLKKKKIRIESPKLETKENMVAEKKEEQKVELQDDDIEKLFSENHKEEKHEEIIEKPSEKKILVNLQDLKNKIKGMLSQNYSKEQIISNLKSQGVNIEQISKAIEEVNLDSLRDYITEALREGLTRDQIIRNLAMHGWKQEQISKVI